MKLDNVIVVSKNKVLYRDGDNCIKLFDEHYSKSDVLNEALNHSRIEETGLNIPKIHEVTLVDGRWAIILEYIEGKTLAQLMAENPEKAIMYAVKGMLPNNTIGRKSLTRLRVYKGAEHEHAAQNPENWTQDIK